MASDNEGKWCQAVTISWLVMYLREWIQSLFFFSKEQNFLVKGEICLDFTCWNIFRLSLKQSLSLTSFYQFVKVSFKGVESGTGSLNFVWFVYKLCPQKSCPQNFIHKICKIEIFVHKILSIKFCTLNVSAIQWIFWIYPSKMYLQNTKKLSTNTCPWLFQMCPSTMYPQKCVHKYQNR